MNQPESTNINRILYREWFPQIMYNHHQTGPAGTVMFSPPFRDPFNYVFDPLVVNTLDQVGAAMHSRFDAEGKPGVTTRSGSNYSTWWNGGLRTMAYFHNQVGLLTESIGNPTPETIGFLPDRLLAKGDLPFPIDAAGRGTSASRSTTRSRRTTRCSISRRATARRCSTTSTSWDGTRSQRGNKDTWTTYPRHVAEIKAAAAKEAGVDAGDPRMQRAAGAARGIATEVLRAAAQAGVARPARLHPAGRSARLQHGDEVHEHADQGRRDRRARDRGVLGGRQAVSRRLVRRAHGAGVPAARARHVRAAGSSERLPVSGRAADSAVRQRRLDARLSRWA